MKNIFTPTSPEETKARKLEYGNKLLDQISKKYNKPDISEGDYIKIHVDNLYLNYHKIIAINTEHEYLVCRASFSYNNTTLNVYKPDKKHFYYDFKLLLQDMNNIQIYIISSSQAAHELSELQTKASNIIRENIFKPAAENEIESRNKEYIKIKSEKNINDKKEFEKIFNTQLEENDILYIKIPTFTSISKIFYLNNDNNTEFKNLLMNKIIYGPYIKSKNLYCDLIYVYSYTRLLNIYKENNIIKVIKASDKEKYNEFIKTNAPNFLKEDNNIFKPADKETRTKEYQDKYKNLFELKYRKLNVNDKFIIKDTIVKNTAEIKILYVGKYWDMPKFDQSRIRYFAGSILPSTEIIAIEHNDSDKTNYIFISTYPELYDYLETYKQTIGYQIQIIPANNLNEDIFKPASKDDIKTRQEEFYNLQTKDNILAKEKFDKTYGPLEKGDLICARQTYLLIINVSDNIKKDEWGSDVFGPSFSYVSIDEKYFYNITPHTRQYNYMINEYNITPIHKNDPKYNEILKEYNMTYEIIDALLSISIGDNGKITFMKPIPSKKSINEIDEDVENDKEIDIFKPVSNEESTKRNKIFKNKEIEKQKKAKKNIEDKYGPLKITDTITFTNNITGFQFKYTIIYFNVEDDIEYIHLKPLDNHYANLKISYLTFNSFGNNYSIEIKHNNISENTETSIFIPATPEETKDRQKIFKDVQMKKIRKYFPIPENAELKNDNILVYTYKDNTSKFLYKTVEYRKILEFNFNRNISESYIKFSIVFSYNQVLNSNKINIFYTDIKYIKTINMSMIMSLIDEIISKGKDNPYRIISKEQAEKEIAEIKKSYELQNNNEIKESADNIFKPATQAEIDNRSESYKKILLDKFIKAKEDFIKKYGDINQHDIILLKNDDEKEYLFQYVLDVNTYNEKFYSNHLTSELYITNGSPVIISKIYCLKNTKSIYQEKSKYILDPGSIYIETYDYIYKYVNLYKYSILHPNTPEYDKLMDKILSIEPDFKKSILNNNINKIPVKENIFKPASETESHIRKKEYYDKLSKDNINAKIELESIFGNIQVNDIIHFKYITYHATIIDVKKRIIELKNFSFDDYILQKNMYFNTLNFSGHNNPAFIHGPFIKTEDCNKPTNINYFGYSDLLALYKSNIIQKFEIIHSNNIQENNQDIFQAASSEDINKRKEEYIEKQIKENIEAKKQLEDKYGPIKEGTIIEYENTKHDFIYKRYVTGIDDTKNYTENNKKFFNDSNGGYIYGPFMYYFNFINKSPLEYIKNKNHLIFNFRASYKSLLSTINNPNVINIKINNIIHESTSIFEPASQDDIKNRKEEYKQISIKRNEDAKKELETKYRPFKEGTIIEFQNIMNNYTSRKYITSINDTRKLHDPKNNIVIDSMTGKELLGPFFSYYNFSYQNNTNIIVPEYNTNFKMSYESLLSIINNPTITNIRLNNIIHESTSIFKPASKEDSESRQKEYFEKIQKQIFETYNTNLEIGDLIVHNAGKHLGSCNYYYIILEILKNEDKFYIITSYNINKLKDYYINGTFDTSIKSFIFYSSLLNFYKLAPKPFKIIKKKDALNYLNSIKKEYVYNESIEPNVIDINEASIFAPASPDDQSKRYNEYMEKQLAKFKEKFGTYLEPGDIFFFAKTHEEKYNETSRHEYYKVIENKILDNSIYVKVKIFTNYGDSYENYLFNYDYLVGHVGDKIDNMYLKIIKAKDVPPTPDTDNKHVKESNENIFKPATPDDIEYRTGYYEKMVLEKEQNAKKEIEEKLGPLNKFDIIISTKPESSWLPEIILSLNKTRYNVTTYLNTKNIKSRNNEYNYKYSELLIYINLSKLIILHVNTPEYNKFLNNNKEYAIYIDAYKEYYKDDLNENIFKPASKDEIIQRTKEFKTTKQQNSKKELEEKVGQINLFDIIISTTEKWWIPEIISSLEDTKFYVITPINNTIFLHFSGVNKIDRLYTDFLLYMNEDNLKILHVNTPEYNEFLNNNKKYIKYIEDIKEHIKHNINENIFKPATPDDIQNRTEEYKKIEITKQQNAKKEIEKILKNQIQLYSIITTNNKAWFPEIITKISETELEYVQLFQTHYFKYTYKRSFTSYYDWLKGLNCGKYDFKLKLLSPNTPEYIQFLLNNENYSNIISKLKQDLNKPN